MRPCGTGAPHLHDGDTVPSSSLLGACVAQWLISLSHPSPPPSLSTTCMHLRPPTCTQVVADQADTIATLVSRVQKVEEAAKETNLALGKRIAAVEASGECNCVPPQHFQRRVVHASCWLAAHCQRAACTSLLMITLLCGRACVHACIRP